MHPNWHAPVLLIVDQRRYGSEIVARSVPVIRVQSEYLKVFYFLHAMKRSLYAGCELCGTSTLRRQPYPEIKSVAKTQAHSDRTEGPGKIPELS